MIVRCNRFKICADKDFCMHANPHKFVEDNSELHEIIMQQMLGIDDPCRDRGYCTDAGETVEVACVELEA